MQPDIIFIVLDTQRADRLGCYGYETATSTMLSTSITPNLDKFAADGVLFEQAVSPAQWTIPSHASFFTGLYPTAHQVTQSAHAISPDLPHLAEMLRDGGYETVGFCNNPLVGILDNGFKRGFDTFYNYGGAFPSTPEHSSSLPYPLNHLAEKYTQFLRRISYPIQNFFAQSDLAFRLSLNAWMTPIWSKLANFKGQNERSAHDVAYFLQERDKEEARDSLDKPLFLFLNLMETHLPFWPPREVVDKIAPYMRESKEAQRIMHDWNREAFRWAAPLEKPLGELEARVLSDMYDAEVAYQDAYLGDVFGAINGRSRKNNTLTVVVADHGDGLGEHGYFGHAFTAYEELIHVPMLMQWPSRLPSPARVSSPVSTRRVYHTILDAAMGGWDTDCADHTDEKVLNRRSSVKSVSDFDSEVIAELTLLHEINGRFPEEQTAYSEVYPPTNFIRAIENNQPHLIERFRCRALRRAIVKAEAGSNYKLIRVDETADELFDLRQDKLELNNKLDDHNPIAPALDEKLTLMAAANKRRQATVQQKTAVGGDDELLLQQLRGLGYVE